MKKISTAAAIAKFYSLTVVKYILEEAGLKIIDVVMNAVNGGSFAVTVCKNSNNSLPSNEIVVDWLLTQEIRMGVESYTPYKDFEEKVYRHRQDLIRLIKGLKSSGKKILGYGASTKGNVLLQFCDFTTKDISAIAEVNPDKYGCFTPGTKIPIISENEALNMKPDYYLVLPWHFKEGILRRETEFLKSGGKFIFPLPEIEII